jgi:hypothetical protein
LGQFIPNLEEHLFWFLAFWDFTQVLLPGVVDFLLQCRILKFVQVCLPGLHDLQRRAQFQHTSGSSTRRRTSGVVMKSELYVLEDQGKYYTVVNPLYKHNTYTINGLTLGCKCLLGASFSCFDFFFAWGCGWPFFVPFVVTVLEKRCGSLLLLSLDKCRDEHLEPGSLLWCSPRLFAHQVLCLDILVQCGEEHQQV